MGESVAQGMYIEWCQSVFELEDEHQTSDVRELVKRSGDGEFCKPHSPFNIADWGVSTAHTEEIVAPQKHRFSTLCAARIVIHIVRSESLSIRVKA